MQLYLASKSPRRQDLLNQLNISFECLNIEIDESVEKNETPIDYVSRMAHNKAYQGWIVESRIENIPLLAADTCVVLGDNILGKPQNRDEACEMLRLLSGETHQVMTSVVIRSRIKIKSSISITDVSFDVLSDKLINYYVDSGECFDKAGSYAIQGIAARFVSHLSGSYSGVVGLPLYETSKLLEQFETVSPS